MCTSSARPEPHCADAAVRGGQPRRGGPPHLAAALQTERRDLRWADPATWHVTLAFYGEVAPGPAAELTAALETVARQSSPVELQLRGATTLGSALVISVHGPALEPLAHACRGAARAVGLDADDRPYRPHLTVARSRDRRRPPREAATALSTYVGPVVTAPELRLVRSHLGPPLRHEPLALLALGAG